MPIDALASPGTALRHDAGSPLRIALLSYRSKPHCGGQGIYVRHLSRELAGLGHRVDVWSGPPYPELDTLEPPGVAPRLVRVPSLDLYREPDPFRTPRWRELHGPADLLEVATMWTGGFPEPLTFSLRAAARLLRRPGRYDVVHDNQSLGYGLLGLRAAAIPLVATIHHPITIDRRHELAATRRWRKRLSLRRWYGFARMQGRVARRLGDVITVSNSSAADIAADFGVDPKRVTVVPVAVDTDVFRPSPAPRVPGRVVAVASSDSPMKGVRVLLEAVAKLRTERDLELVVVGKPKPRGAVIRAVEDLGLRDAVRFVSGLPDAALAELFGSAEVAVVPSLYEGFSIPAIEAMACATPVVASRAGALPEVVGVDGACADLVETGNPEAMAAAIAGLLDNPARGRALGEAGRRRVEERFTWRAVAVATVDVYRDAIARRRRAC